MASAVEITKLPDHQQVELAREGSAALARLLRNHPQQDRARVRMPLGLDIGARTPDEIAVSAAAELVSWRRARASQSA